MQKPFLHNHCLLIFTSRQRLNYFIEIHGIVSCCFSSKEKCAPLTKAWTENGKSFRNFLSSRLRRFFFCALKRKPVHGWWAPVWYWRWRNKSSVERKTAYCFAIFRYWDVWCRNNNGIVERRQHQTSYPLWKKLQGSFLQIFRLVCLPATTDESKTQKTTLNKQISTAAISSTTQFRHH